MKLLLFFLFTGFSINSFSQVADSANKKKVIVHSDYRLAILARKESEINTAILKSQARTARGYRLTFSEGSI